MAIEQAVIDQAKRTDLVALVKAKGIELKKKRQRLLRPLSLPRRQEPVFIHQPK